MQANVPKYKYFLLLTTLLLLLGLADTAYLTVIHYRNYTDITYSSFCALSKSVNCDTVSQSPWSVLLGIPIAIWGFTGYLLFGMLLIQAGYRKKEKLSIWSLLLVLGAFYSMIAIYFGYISTTKIHSYCILCLVSYLINFLLFYIAWIIRYRLDKSPIWISINNALKYLIKQKTFKFSITIFIVVLMAIKLFIPHYWEYALPPVTKEIPSGLTNDYHPWIGSNNPLLTIEEYSDYQCFQCYKAHFMLRRLIAKYPDKIRLIHHHFPMDHTVNDVIVPEPFHIGAGKMAMIAIYAALNGKFWQTNDILFELGQKKKPFNTKTLAEKTGFSSTELAMATRDTKIHILLRNDIRAGMKLGINGTPSFVINGKVYKGTIPSEIIEEIIQ